LRREEHFRIGVALERRREHLGEVLGGRQLEGPPLTAVDHRRLHGAHVASQVDRQRARDLLLAPLDEQIGVRLPRVCRAVPDPGERQHGGEDENCQPRGDGSASGGKRAIRGEEAHHGTSF
jgi:hypothetical protein